MRRALAEAAREELNRQRQEAARSNLLDFTNFTFERYKPDPAHGLIAQKLDRVVAGNLSRLMIFAPPQHGKSELASVRLPAFWLAHRPDDPIILTSYAASLAYNKSRQARDILESPEYADLFPDIETDRASRAVDHWELAPPHRGGMLAAGVGGPITGHGAALGIIDDPFENWQQAHSQTIRDRVWGWYRTTFRTRVWENGAIVLIMTRWHEDDLAGRLLLDQAERWEVLRLPATGETQEDRDRRNKRLGIPAGQPDPLGREPGEPLCPSRYSAEALAELRDDVGSLAWEGQYMGSPTLPEGNRFKRAWFPIVDAAPAKATRVRYWDLAGSTTEAAKRTAGVRMCGPVEGIYYVEHVVKGKWSTGERNKNIRQTAELDGRAIQIRVEQEPGSSGLDTIRDLVKLLAGFTMRPDRVTGSKDVRQEPFAAQCEAGNVRLVRGDWNGDYIEEMCAVPNGRYRDQADASAGAFNHLTTTGWARGASG
jgi:predicted phage terminase large subunit-like protein